jgi:phage FluMu protein gp41
MATALYVVIFSQERWWVDFEGKAHGPFETRETAALEGRDLARMSSHSGRNSELLCPDDRGRYHVVWASAKERHAA